MVHGKDSQPRVVAPLPRGHDSVVHGKDSQPRVVAPPLEVMTQWSMDKTLNQE